MSSNKSNIPPSPNIIKKTYYNLIFAIDMEKVLILFLNSY